jgi:GH25 family lysozyme M1 (1,4-beta-N-acetylmuramidase)
MKTGADISHWQARFDAAAYKRAGEDFIILKATEATTFIDDTFRLRWQAAKNANLPRIAYHFARPSRTSARAQADFFIKVVELAGWRPNDVWALDYECDQTTLRGNALTDWAESWSNQVAARLGGPGLFYSYIPYIKGQMGNPGRVPGSSLAWIARYASAPYLAPHTRPAGWPEPPHVWQCGNGEVGCVKDVASIGRCDYNQMTDAAFTRLFSGESSWPDGPLTDDDLRAIRGAFIRALE